MQQLIARNVLGVTSIHGAERASQNSKRQTTTSTIFLSGADDNFDGIF